MTPHRCPVCDGSGLVSRPPWVAGDQETWATTSCGPWPCGACDGHGILWAPRADAPANGTPCPVIPIGAAVTVRPGNARTIQVPSSGVVSWATGYEVAPSPVGAGPWMVEYEARP